MENNEDLVSVVTAAAWIAMKPHLSLVNEFTFSHLKVAIHEAIDEYARDVGQP